MKDHAVNDKGWGSMVSIATGLWAEWSGLQILLGSRSLYLQNVQMSSGVHPASNSLSTALFLGGKVAGVWHGFKHSPLSTLKVKNE
jgi:hypothetical protein